MFLIVNMKKTYYKNTRFSLFFRFFKTKIIYTKIKNKHNIKFHCTYFIIYYLIMSRIFFQSEILLWKLESIFQTYNHKNFKESYSLKLQIL